MNNPTIYQIKNPVVFINNGNRHLSPRESALVKLWRAENPRRTDTQDWRKRLTEDEKIFINEMDLKYQARLKGKRGA